MMQVYRLVFFNPDPHELHQFLRLILNHILKLEYGFPREEWVQHPALVLVYIVWTGTERTMRYIQGVIEACVLCVLGGHGKDLIVVLGVAEVDFVGCDSYNRPCCDQKKPTEWD